MRKKLLVLLFILLFLLLFLLGLLIYSFVSKLNASSGPTEAEAEAGLEPDDGQSEQTATPKLVGRTFVAQDRYCIAGNGEEGAKIRVEGGNATAYAEVTDGQFIAEIFVDAQSEADIDISVYATLEGKSESEPLSFVIKSGEARSYRPVYVGKDNHLHYADTLGDFFGNNLFSDRDLDRIRSNAENLQQLLIDEGLKTKLVIFISPNHGTIYPETMSDFLTEMKSSDDSRLKQLIDEFRFSSVKFVTPYDRLMKEKENHFLYIKTDTHWNELGAYFGYCELFDYIGEFFPAAKPIELSQFNVYQKSVRGGDIIPMLEFDQEKYRENSTLVRIKNPVVPELFRGDTDEIPYQEGFYHQYHEYDTGDASKPTILMYRDSFSISMMSYMAETSGKIVFNSMWDYNINMDFVKALNPDFLVVQKVERSLGDLGDVFSRFR